MRRGLVALLLCAGVAGCTREAWRDDTVPPFREAEYGAGLDRSASGRRVDISAQRGGLVARYRVSSTGMRVYGADATQLGRVVPRDQGWDVVRVDGTVACGLHVDGARGQVACGDLTLDVVRNDQTLTVHAGERLHASILRLEDGGWGATYGDESDPTVRYDAGAISVRTHADARRWLDVGPLSWDPPVLVASQLDVDATEPSDAPLVRAGLMFVVGELRGTRAALSVRADDE